MARSVMTISPGALPRPVYLFMRFKPTCVQRTFDRRRKSVALARCISALFWADDLSKVFVSV